MAKILISWFTVFFMCKMHNTFCTKKKLKSVTARNTWEHIVYTCFSFCSSEDLKHILPRWLMKAARSLKDYVNSRGFFLSVLLVGILSNRTPPPKKITLLWKHIDLWQRCQPDRLFWPWPLFCSSQRASVHNTRTLNWRQANCNAAIINIIIIYTCALPAPESSEWLQWIGPIKGFGRDSSLDICL